MQIREAVFTTSIASAERYSEIASGSDTPEICVVGRSNVGKSSFINALAGQKKLAKTSSTPGRTRLINLFDFNRGAFVLVDLPGYGFAAAGKAEKSKWSALIEGYLQASVRLRHVFALVDIRHEPGALDKQMLTYMYHYGLPFTLVATKSDKLSRAQASRAVQTLASALAVGRDDIIAFSSQTGQGKEAVLQRLDCVLQ